MVKLQAIKNLNVNEQAHQEVEAVLGLNCKQDSISCQTQFGVAGLLGGADCSGYQAELGNRLSG